MSQPFQMLEACARQRVVAKAEGFKLSQPLQMLESYARQCVAAEIEVSKS